MFAKGQEINRQTTEETWLGKLTRGSLWRHKGKQIVLCSWTQSLQELDTQLHHRLDVAGGRHVRRSCGQASVRGTV